MVDGSVPSSILIGEDNAWFVQSSVSILSLFDHLGVLCNERSIRLAAGIHSVSEAQLFCAETALVSDLTILSVCE